MTLYTLDTIIKRTLLAKGLTVHWYLDFLVLGSDALRELSFDTLKIVNYQYLPLNAQGAADLPEDFVDDVYAALPVANKLQKIPKDNKINPLRLSETTGDYTTYTSSGLDTANGDALYPYAIFIDRYNSYGEPTGGLWGVGGGATVNTYTIVKSRNQLQMNESSSADGVFLAYISDGQSVDAASQIDSRAVSAIQAYITWKSSQGANSQHSAEGQLFYNERRLLRARLNTLTTTDIKNIIRSHYRATPKS